MNPVAYFSNDNGVAVQYHMNHRFAGLFGSRNEHEVMFRRISTYLINQGHIRGNIVDLGAWIGDNAVPWSKNLQMPPKAASCGFDPKSLLMAQNATSERLDAKNNDTQNPQLSPSAVGAEGALVYAIDPSPDNCQFIRDLASLNNIQNIRVIEKAISDKREVLCTNDDLTHCSFVSDEDSLTVRNQVNAWSLDDLYAAGEIADVAYIHLDVEGMENRVVAGAQKLINTYKPIIAFEQHLEQDPFIELSAHIAEKGYVVYLINEVLPGCRPDCRNFMAFPIDRFDDAFVEAINAHLGQDVLERLLL
jgi:FkbM family methyltransferase